MNLDELKTAINSNDTDRAASIIVDLYKKSPNNFKKTLLLSNSLPEPLGRDFEEKKLKTLLNSFILSAKKLIDEGINIIPFTNEYLQITQAISIINHNLKNNLKRLESNKFSDYTLSEQIQMFCIYIEDQKRLSNIQETKDIQYITGMEGQVAKFKADNNKDVKVSKTDNFEAVLEMADTLFRLLYYRAGKKIEKAENFLHEGISPYEIESLEEIMHLALQRNLFNFTWGKFKYREWKLRQVEYEKEKYNIFEPFSREEHKKELIGINRYIYRDHINLQQENAKNLEGKRSYRFIEECSKYVDVDNIQSLFLLKKNEYFKASDFTKIVIKSQLKSVEEVYNSVKLDGVNMEDIIKGFEYLYTIALIYQQAVEPNFNEDDVMQYRKLSPIIHKDSIVDHFNEIYDMDFPTSEKIISNFIFTGKSKMDIFSQPLAYVGKNNVVFCPSLITQMNMVRIIEMLTTDYNIDISDKGTEFERQLRFILSFNPHIKVNTNKLTFKAYDGRDIEFDFVGMFEDHLLLIELKNLKIPFSDRSYKSSLDTIKVGIDQVNRRANVIKNDWAILKEKCSFTLPEEPVEESKIIKLVCTNIFNFSTFIRDGVEIIDSSSLLKFLMAPQIKGISIGEEVEEVYKRNLWKNNYPTVTEFKDFLKCPVAIEPYINCYEEAFKPIGKIEADDYNISFFDYNLIRDPYENLYDDLQRSNQKTKNIKIGRNSTCPCESGKKYKKCCGA
ncbi:YecA family protein [Peribacillus butanolivorans]|uniref:YecA family protein n=1 Tax=Peribacillus butanolivorans TaxID=421767 RepID=UPI00364E1756